MAQVLRAKSFAGRILERNRLCCAIEIKRFATRATRIARSAGSAIGTLTKKNIKGFVKQELLNFR